MEIQETPIAGLLVVQPRVFGDSRGFFLETFHRERYQAAGLNVEFVQDNHSRSRKGILRGLHYQLTRPQGKLVQVTRGAVFDVAVDLRKQSPSFGRWYGHILSDENHAQMFVPPGCAHGFCVLSDDCDFVYKCTDTYLPEDEHTLKWNDPSVGIDWPDVGTVSLSAKDEMGKSFGETPVYELSPPAPQRFHL